MSEYLSIKSKIINSLILIPGINGFINSKPETAEHPLKKLDKGKWNDAIDITKKLNKLTIDLNIVISPDMNATNLCATIDNNINLVLKKDKLVLYKLNIYIKGVHNAKYKF